MGLDLAVLLGSGELGVLDEGAEEGQSLLELGGQFQRLLERGVVLGEPLGF